MRFIREVYFPKFECSRPEELKFGSLSQSQSSQDIARQMISELTSFKSSQDRELSGVDERIEKS